MRLTRAAEKTLSPGLSFDGESVEAFFAFKDAAKLGVALKANLKAGLRGDDFLKNIMPGEPPQASTTSTASSGRVESIQLREELDPLRSSAECESGPSNAAPPADLGANGNS